MNEHNLSLTEELIECCHNEINLEKVKLLVEKGAKLNYMGKKTPLHVIINSIIEKYEANPYKPIISPEHYPKHIKLFIWIIENGHKYIDNEVEKFIKETDKYFRQINIVEFIKIDNIEIINPLEVGIVFSFKFLKPQKIFWTKLIGILSLIILGLTLIML